MGEFGFAFCTEKISDKGEDAPPVWGPLSEDGWVLAVCDGMGGAGSFCYTGAEGKTGAKIAAESVCDWTRAFFTEPFELPGLEAVLTEKIRALADELDGQEPSPSKLRSKLHKRLPTTFAGMVVRSVDSQWRSTSVWAGDSRCFCLSPEYGLQQLSVDDQREQCDPFESLWLEPQMSNYVNADTEFRLNAIDIVRDRPTVFLVATDGCFQYVETPAHFEQLLLSSLGEAESFEEWGDAVSQAIGRVTGDDASMALQAFGWSSFEALKSAFRSRLDWLAVLMRIGDEPSENGERDRVAERAKIWSAYKAGYCARMPDKLIEVGHAAN